MRKRVIFLLAFLPATFTFSSSENSIWGFYGHKLITEMAIYTLPVEVIPFFKHHKGILMNKSLEPDRRRYVNPQEGPRHYIDLDLYSNTDSIPHYWLDAVEKFSQDTLEAKGIGPWHTYFTYRNLSDAMKRKNVDEIIRYAADLSHYVADAHVPLHTTSNYNGQNTNQKGIHGFWESRIPELFAQDFDFWVGRAEYMEKPLSRIWESVYQANSLTDSLFRLERDLTKEMGMHRKYVFEARGKNQVKVVSKKFAEEYLSRFPYLEEQMRSSIKMIGDLWFTAWVEAGQPDLSNFPETSIDQEATTPDSLRLNPLRPHEY